MGYGYNYYPPYVSVAQRRAKAEKKLKQLRKKNPNLKPIQLKSQTLANSWWGKSWNKNLERYADYENRIGRGRSYVRHSAVLDLQIKPGKVTALVLGSGRSPYKVTIDIKPIAKKEWKHIVEAAQTKTASLQDLLDGRFPKTLQDTFMTQGKGLFPAPKEISFNCSCPDWATMCKHVAATLYGIGARLDEDPLLFFTLRKANVDDLVSQVVQDQSKKLLKKSKRKSTRVIADSNLGDIFGIEMDSIEAVAKPRRAKKVAKKIRKTTSTAKKKTTKKKVTKRKIVKATKKKTAKKKVTKKKVAATNLAKKRITKKKTTIKQIR